MIVRPYGWALWEKHPRATRPPLQATGHQNVAFPLLIPKSFIEKESITSKDFPPNWP